MHHWHHGSALKVGTTFLGIEAKLGVAAAACLVSALIERPVPPDVVRFGEVGLSGELRPVGQESARLREAARLGFERALAPLAPVTEAGAAPRGLAAIGVRRLSDLAEWLREGA